MPDFPLPSGSDPKLILRPANGSMAGADLELSQGHLSQAVQQYSAILEAVSTERLSSDGFVKRHISGAARHKRGIAYVLSREWAAARDDFREAVLLRPRDPEPLIDLGFALLETGDLRESCRAFEQALHLEPASKAAKIGLADSRFSGGK